MHRHMSAVISPSGSILGIGYNHYPNNGWNSVHAEIHSVTNTISNIIRKEGRSRIVKSPLSVNVIVVRSNGSNSRPCHNCIHQLAENPYINVQKVYYSMINDSGVSVLAVETMGTLLSNSDVHVSRGNMECIFEDEDEPVKPEQHSIPVHTVLSNREFVKINFFIINI
jgi:deoxycytidylate deaminase